VFANSVDVFFFSKGLRISSILGAAFFLGFDEFESCLVLGFRGLIRAARVQEGHFQDALRRANRSRSLFMIAGVS